MSTLIGAGSNFVESFYHKKHELFMYRKCNQNQNSKRRKFKTREQVLAFYDELRRKVRTNPRKSRDDSQQLSELFHHLRDYIEYYLSEEMGGEKQLNLENSILHLQIEKKKQEMLLKYYNTVDEFYGNVYKIKIEDFDSEFMDMKLYLKISHKSRVDQLLIILEHCQCLFNQYFIVNNDLQLYKYLELSVKFGNVYENVKYLVYENPDFKSKVVNYFISRECKTNYNNFKKYKHMKIKILLRYINSLLNRYGSGKDYVNNYVIYLTSCVKYFQSCGHLKDLNKYQNTIPKMIRIILTRNTHKFKYNCKLNYPEILRNIGQYDASMLEQSLFLDHSVHSMQIYKYIQTDDELLLLDIDKFIEHMFNKIVNLKPLSSKKYYHYLIYKFGYYNNDLFIDKYNEIQTILKHYISQQVSNIILTKDFNLYLANKLLSKLSIETITKSDPNWKSHLATLYQYLLSSSQ